MRGRVTKYWAAATAPRLLLRPWDDYLDAYGSGSAEIVGFIKSAEDVWSGAGIPPDLRPLFESVRCVQDPRDEIITAEYRTRMNLLRSQRELVATRMALVVSLVFFTVGQMVGQLQTVQRLWLLAVLGLAVVAYFFLLERGALLFHTVRRWIQTGPDSIIAKGPAEEMSLAATIQNLRSGPLTLLLGPNSSIVDLAYALELWGYLRPTNPQVRISTDRTQVASSKAIVIGGPLVIPTEGLPEAVCAFVPTDPVHSNWGYVVGSELIADSAGSDAVACLSSSRVPTTLYMNSFRNIGLRDAVAHLIQIFERVIDPEVGLSAWILIKTSSGEEAPGTTMTSGPPKTIGVAVE
jgi:hypothetical protein